MAVLEEEMARVRDRHGCTAAAEEVQLAMRRMVRQMLHEPTIRARQAAANGTLDEYEAALETVFGLDVAEAIKQSSPTTAVQVHQPHRAWTRSRHNNAPHKLFVVVAAVTSVNDSSGTEH